MTNDSAVPAEFGVVASRLVKRFGRAIAVRDATFSLPARGVCGLLGPNGAGKTTTIRMVAGLTPPDAGELLVAGCRADAQSDALRARVGYLPESAPLYPELTVAEYLSYRAGLVGLDRSLRRRRIGDAMSRCDVAGFSHRLCGLLSKGMQQRVGLAATILGDPSVVILDEPSVGLDPSQVLAFRQLVRELGENRLVLFSSHLLTEVESVCSELIVLAHGRVVAHESLERFKARAADGGRYFVESERAFAAAAEASAICEVIAESPLPDGWTRTEFRATGAEDPRAAVGRLLAEVRIPIRAMGVVERTAEQVFVSLVQEAAP